MSTEAHIEQELSELAYERAARGNAMAEYRRDNAALIAENEELRRRLQVFYLGMYCLRHGLMKPDSPLADSILGDGP